MKLCIGLCATARYLFAIQTLARKIERNVALADYDEVELVFVTDDDPACRTAAETLRWLLPSITVYQIAMTDLKFGAAYKQDMQVSLARMQGAAFDRARRIDADHFWSLEADIVPPENALRCMQDMLRFDGGYYDIAFCPYPSQGGGSFLSGHGSLRSPINADFTEDERKLSPAYLEARTKARAKDATQEDFDLARKELDKCPPKAGVFALNAKRWRRRGWFDCAYPAIGKGACVPVDWVGMGCNLFSEKALAISTFDGYSGHGTQDLFLCWHRYDPAGMRMVSIPHAPCSHIVRERVEGEEGQQDFTKLSILHAYHEQDGETRGHLRYTKREFFDL